ncbi:hypothetical protein EVAR_86188_1 [Eumeta japonica]|uniref:Uncharacterized protein n=1 Tax=Eumeta variegata TaxID=151549 RepID=A0A4C1UBG9_EUMVA|nr:hypothetical protein EVAR_86188_1 [Eumeta japonica]
MRINEPFTKSEQSYRCRRKRRRRRTSAAAPCSAGEPALELPKRRRCAGPVSRCEVGSGTIVLHFISSDSYVIRPELVEAVARARQL